MKLDNHYLNNGYVTLFFCNLCESGCYLNNLFSCGCYLNNIIGDRISFSFWRENLCLYYFNNIWRENLCQILEKEYNVIIFFKIHYLNNRKKKNTKTQKQNKQKKKSTKQSFLKTNKENKAF